MPDAEIISIGTELLLGEIVDTNAAVIARALRDVGVNLYRKTVIGDNAARIAGIIRGALERSDIVITTGGLGPTVDDPTREAVARAFGVELEFRQDLWDQILERFARYGRLPTENNRRQAYIPKGAEPIENPIGTAPSFVMPMQSENGLRLVFSLPGVPAEMEHLLFSAVIPILVDRFDIHGIIKTRILHTASIGESQIDSLIGDLETLTNPTVGLAAHTGRVDVRITARAASLEEAQELIRPIETDLRSRLGKWIYGADAETLEGIALSALEERSWKAAFVEAGVGGALLAQMRDAGANFAGGQLFPTLTDPQVLPELTRSARQTYSADIALGVGLSKNGMQHKLYIYLVTPEGEKKVERSYGGPPEYAPRFAVHQALDTLRRL